MDFFAQQARVRRSSRQLVLLFTLAVLATVVAIDFVVWIAFGQHAGVYGEPAGSNLPLLLLTSVGVLVGIGGASLYRVASLSGGGRSVAEGVGAVPVPANTSDPALRRLRNVIEEVAIASGVAVPDIYVMEDEPGINAFAAGYSVADAAVCVTRGCLDALNRDELQGVVAHEFSHVLNGDMRLNIRLMGLLFGILVLTVVGRQIAYGGAWSSRRRGGQLVLIGIALVVVGYIGYFFARLIQAAVSRSRESLADASAVQFTRQTAGIAGALKKIAIAEAGSSLRAANRHEVAHMLFGEAGGFNALFATHPPLMERIRVLEPGFSDRDLARFAAQAAAGDDAASATAAPGAVPPLHPAAASGFAATAASAIGTPPPMPAAMATGLAGAAATMASPPALPTSTTGIPAALRTAVQQPATALAVVLALACSSATTLAPPEHRIIANAFGDDAAAASAHQLAAIANLDPGNRLPLVSLAFPALRQLSDGQRQTLLDALDALVLADGRVDLAEYCLTRLVRVQLQEAANPRHAPVDGKKKLPACRASLVLVCAIVAIYGQNGDETAAKRAWLLAMQQVFPGEAVPWVVPPRAWAKPFEAALDDLDGLSPPAKELAVRGLVAAIEADGEVSLVEAELLRVICASLHCPVPLG